MGQTITIKSSLKYKMLQLVIVQAAFLVIVLTGISLINPNWVLWSEPQSPENAKIIKDFKHEYGMLNTLNMQLSSFRILSTDEQQIFSPNTVNPSATYQQTVHALLQHISNVKTLSKKGQANFNVDFSVLVSFLFRYQDQIKRLGLQSTGFEERLWSNQLYFSRIQSEFFYIIEEVDRVEVAQKNRALQSAQTSLFIWGAASLMLLAISTFIALSHARKWKVQIASLLNLAYRASIKSNSIPQPAPHIIDDELDYLASVLHRVLNDDENFSQPK